MLPNTQPDQEAMDRGTGESPTHPPFIFLLLLVLIFLHLLLFLPLLLLLLLLLLILLLFLLLILLLYILLPFLLILLLLLQDMENRPEHRAYFAVLLLLARRKVFYRKTGLSSIKVSVRLLTRHYGEGSLGRADLQNNGREGRDNLMKRLFILVPILHWAQAYLRLVAWQCCSSGSCAKFTMAGMRLLTYHWLAPTLPKDSYCHTYCLLQTYCSIDIAGNKGETTTFNN